MNNFFRSSFIIYEYSDYNCGYCKRLFKTLQTLINEDDDIQIVIKEFPILAESSVLAAKAALAAEEQNKFFEYHLALMNSVGRITEDSLKSIATMVGLNMEKYTAAISSNKFDRILRRNIDSGNYKGVDSHILRVFLIDSNKVVRNIYSVSFLHSKLLINDIINLSLEK